MIVFTNDNGAPNYINVPGANYPYRGWKGSFFEGGIKMPLFMKFPPKIRPGLLYTPVVSLIDIFPTVAAVAGIPIHHSIDGVNLIPHITAVVDNITLSPALDTVHQSLFWRSGHYKAYRQGRYKLQVSLHRPEKEWLCDMIKDPTEQVNLVDAARPGAAGTVTPHPRQDDDEEEEDVSAVLTRMRNGLLLEEAKHRASLWPSLSETPVLIDRISGDYNAGDEYIYWAN